MTIHGALKEEGERWGGKRDVSQGAFYHTIKTVQSKNNYISTK